MIIQSQKDDTRTIVSHGGGLEEMECGEFIEKLRSTVSVPSAATTIPPDGKGGNSSKLWIHFEGRIPDVTNACVAALRNMAEYADAVVSVECEKPDRRGLDRAAGMADVVFYSKLWAEVSYVLDFCRWRKIM